MTVFYVRAVIETTLRAETEQEADEKFKKQIVSTIEKKKHLGSIVDVRVSEATCDARLGYIPKWSKKQDYVQKKLFPKRKKELRHHRLEPKKS